MPLVCKIKNIDNVEIELQGIILAVNEEYTISPSYMSLWASDDDVLFAISNGTLLVSDGLSYFDNISESINHIKGIIPFEVAVRNINPFGAKIVTEANGDIFKLFKRVHGMQASLSQGENIINFEIPYVKAKITGIECINGEPLDIVNLYIIHPTYGVLNQFGFNVNISKDYYEHKSEYDADLVQYLIVRVAYNSASAKTIGINIILNELVAA